MRKIGSFTPIWNQEMWIKPHFEMLSKLDRNVVFLHERPFPNYEKEHGYSIIPDLSETILRTQFPNVEIYESHYPQGKEFGADVYNEGMQFLRDCDIVFRLDPDMFFEEKVWDDFLKYIQETDFEAYRMDFNQQSVNYYMTNDFEHGLKDAQEFDPLALNPKYRLETPVVLHNGKRMVSQFQYPHGNDVVIDFPGFFCHHFRGWNKPKSTPNPGWLETPFAKQALEKYGPWQVCPESIRTKVENWQKELEVLKNEQK
jgi:hypothetical protein